MLQREVFSRFRPFELVLCHSTLISLVNAFGKDHDLLVKTWHQNITETLCPVDASTMDGILEPVTILMEDDDSENNDDEDDDEEYDELEFD
uniref:Uncharacterized protein n=1 Tax=Amphimedon queenslandica TaxID=400682 RepID=A0A1X7UXE5_AMPQE